LEPSSGANSEETEGDEEDDEVTIVEAGDTVTDTCDVAANDVDAITSLMTGEMHTATDIDVVDVLDTPDATPTTLTDVLVSAAMELLQVEDPPGLCPIPLWPYAIRWKVGLSLASRTAAASPATTWSSSATCRWCPTRC